MSLCMCKVEATVARLYFHIYSLLIFLGEYVPYKVIMPPKDRGTKKIIFVQTRGITSLALEVSQEH